MGKRSEKSNIATNVLISAARCLVVLMSHSDVPEVLGQASPVSILGQL